MGATSASVRARIPMNANVSRVWNDCGTGGRSGRASRVLRSQPDSKCWSPSALGAGTEGARASGVAGFGNRASAMSVLGELVAGAADGQDELRQGRVVLDLVPKVGHVDVDRLLVLVERLVVTEQLEQLPAREDPAGARGEVAQDLELGGGQPDPPVPTLDSAALEVDDEVAVADHAAAGGVREVAVRAPEQRPDPTEQLAQRERLGDVVVRPELQADHLVEFVAPRGQEQPGCLRARRAQAPQDLEAVDAGKLDVEDDEVGGLGRREGESLLSRPRDADLVTLGLERVLDAPRNGELVFDDEDGGHPAMLHAAARRPFSGRLRNRRRRGAATRRSPGTVRGLW